jgi:rhodanese-related sulfurtransferase
VAQALAARGVKEAHPLIGGFDAWKQAHLPVERIKSKAA